MSDDVGDNEVKSPNPRLQFRLPREDNFTVVPFDDRPPLMEQAQAVLGPRLKETREGFTLDGKVRNIRDILKVAGLKFKDE
jgi:hypothetical protein